MTQHRMTMAPDAPLGGAADSRSFSTRELRDCFAQFATGVAVITGVRPDGEPVGVTANSLTSVSLDPPLLLWCLAAHSQSVAAFASGARFAVHVLAHSQRDLAMHFARSGRQKFEVDPCWRSDPRPPHLAETLCRFDCEVNSVHAGGDHLVIVAEVLAVSRMSGAASAPLLFHGGRFGRFAADPGSPQIEIWKQWGEEWI